MAMTDDEYVDEYIKRMIRLNRAFEGETTKISSSVKTLHKDIIAKVEARYPSMSSRRIKALNREIVDLVVDKYNNEIIPEENDVFKEIIKRESEWSNKLLGNYSPERIKGVNVEKVARRALNKTYQGHTFKYWFNANKVSTYRKLNSTLQAGYTRGATTGEVVQEVGRILGRQDKDIKTLTRSYLQHASAEARYENFAQNDHVLEGYYWVSVLDARTTFDICGIRDGLFYDTQYKAIGHKIEWKDGPGRIHFNCRSGFIAKPKGSGDMRDMFTRPAINSGKNYESGDLKTRNGTVRKARKASIEKGTFDVSNVKGSTNYETWLRRQKSAYVGDIIGNKGLVADFKAGRKSLLDIVSGGSASEIKNL